MNELKEVLEDITADETLEDVLQAIMEIYFPEGDMGVIVLPLEDLEKVRNRQEQEEMDEGLITEPRKDNEMLH